MKYFSNYRQEFILLYPIYIESVTWSRGDFAKSYKKSIDNDININVLLTEILAVFHCSACLPTCCPIIWNNGKN